MANLNFQNHLNLADLLGYFYLQFDVPTPKYGAALVANIVSEQVHAKTGIPNGAGNFLDCAQIFGLP